MNHPSKIRIWLHASVAAVALTAAPAFADAKREAALESRVQQLEAAVAELRAMVGEARSAQAAATAQVEQSGAVVARTEERLAALEKRPTPPAEGFNVGGTTVKLNGYVKTNAMFSRFSDGELAGTSLGRDFYLPQTIPIGGAGRQHAFDFTGKQTRLWFTTSTPVGSKAVKTHVEFDFQTTQGAGTERTTNGFNLALRRGFISYGEWLAGQEWSNFMTPATLPESTIPLRFPLIYTAKALSEKTARQGKIDTPDSAVGPN